MSGVSKLLLFEEQEHEDGVAMWTGTCLVVKEITIQGLEWTGCGNSTWDDVHPLKDLKGVLKNRVFFSWGTYPEYLWEMAK